MVWSSVWDNVFRKNEWGKYPDESLIRFVAGKYYGSPNRKKIKILEVGCGPGANLWYLCREGFDVYGVDASHEAISIARKRFSDEHLKVGGRLELLKVELLVADIMELQYPDDYFDCVVDIECLYSNSFADTEIILEGIHRIMKKGGYLFSKSISNNMYLGKGRHEESQMEFNKISDGPVEGKGYARTMRQLEINRLYGQCFNVDQIDLHEYTRNNQTILNSEWVIVCSKR